VEADEPVEVYSTNNPNEAEIIRAALAGEGIPSQVTGENQAGLAGLDMLPITIVVRASDYDRAREFIEEHQRNETDEEADEETELDE
jgi:hypothetical protein